MNERWCKKRRRERYEVRDDVAIQDKKDIFGLTECLQDRLINSDYLEIRSNQDLVSR